MLVLGGTINLGTNNTNVADLTSIPVYDTIAMSWDSNILTTGFSPSARFGHSAVISMSIYFLTMHKSVLLLLGELKRGRIY